MKETATITNDDFSIKLRYIFNLTTIPNSVVFLKYLLYLLYMTGIRTVARKFIYSFKGIVHAAIKDTGFRAQLIVGIPGLLLVWYFGKPLSEIDMILITLATLLVLITELQNSAFESALDHLHPEMHHNIGHSKDMAAGAVLLSAVFALIVAIVIVWF